MESLSQEPKLLGHLIQKVQTTQRIEYPSDYWIQLKRNGNDPWQA